jgi:hypothetical protein
MLSRRFLPSLRGAQATKQCNPGCFHIKTVITALVAVIHVLLSFFKDKDVDGRDEARP